MVMASIGGVYQSDPGTSEIMEGLSGVTVSPDLDQAVFSQTTDYVVEVQTGGMNMR